MIEPRFLAEKQVVDKARGWMESENETGSFSMKEKDLRKYHRTLGVILAVFVLVQAGTGLYLTFEYHGFLSTLHFGGGAIGMVYRSLLAFGMIGLVITGLSIYLKRRARG